MEVNFPKRLVVPVVVLLGAATGFFIYLLYVARMPSYLSDDPSACVNCHIMAPYYQSWQKSSHQAWASCNECHVPHDNVFRQYGFKAKDGLYHASVFTFRMEPQVLRPREESYGVIMENCIRCHTQLNTEFVKTGMLSYADTQKGMGKACWDCHREVPHGRVSNLAMSPNAIVPLPESPVPQWLKKIMQ
ncbi:MAG: cytochrome c nitrite reductase small subunit [Bacteroidetes bacterium HGW-Bacteroidetes-14]|jgi:cytochrome c nitrite reductase small subunit|nr:MAG: cytochrome c nitrite reductase small subunit [Bacteroidetes bacterium HGW-Bacteroidetes-14]